MLLGIMGCGTSACLKRGDLCGMQYVLPLTIAAATHEGETARHHLAGGPQQHEVSQGFGLDMSGSPKICNAPCL